MGKPVILYIGDSPSESTGFGVVARNILLPMQNHFDIHVLGLNYFGDYTPIQSKLKLYNPSKNGDEYGLSRVNALINTINPDVIFILNDPWVVCEYLRIIDTKKHKVVFYSPIDAEHLKSVYGDKLNNATAGITYTDFARKEFESAGLKIPIHVIPHGVNTTFFHPVRKIDARKELGLKDDWYVVTYVARNQARKRVDLFTYLMHRWLKKYPHDNVYFHYHGSTKDVGIDIEDCAAYYNIDNRLILTARNMEISNSIPIDRLKYVYNSADLYFHVCPIEGWGLPLLEAMACRVPALVPNYSALSEWPRGGVEYVDIDRDYPTFNTFQVNTIHYYYPKIDEVIEKLELLYQNSEYRQELAQRGYKLATAKKFNWSVIAQQFVSIMKDVIKEN